MLAGSQRNAVEAESAAVTGSRVSLGKFEVCHVASGDRWAGAEVQLAALLKAFQRNAELSISAIFLNDGRPADEARQSGTEVCVFDETRQNFFQILSGATHFLHGKNIQVLHSHRYKENLLAALLARRCHVPVHVCSRHGAPEPFTGWRGYKQNLVEALDRWVAHHCTDCVVSVSGELHTQLTRYLPSNKVVTIYNGIDAETVCSRFNAAEAKQRLGIPVECWVVGTAGRLDPIKRLDIFLAAAQQIASVQPNSKFVIAGDGTEESRLRGLATALGLEDRVLFLGHRDDIYDVLRAMDIFVLCSDHEGLPMALLETLYLGVAVVARPVGGVGEVVQDGVNGVWVPSSAPSDLAEACLQLLHDDVRRNFLARAGAELVAKQFTADRTADRVAELYSSLYEARAKTLEEAIRIKGRK
ncbi:MAG: glycosyltransferase [Candidatus Acidiferrales bacterium]